ncbi:MAG: hypothetical protein KGS72_27530 [Cyanobacteria bacterium REEB67]|nr:hypothetical protein [Cyanobacteria bacterium REEB67]
MTSITTTYTYDNLSRLQNVALEDSNLVTSSADYSFDTVGNRTQVVLAPPPSAPGPAPGPMAAGFPNRNNGDFKNSPMMIMLSTGELMGWGDNATAVLANGTEAATNSLAQYVTFDPNTTKPPAGAKIVDWEFTNANLYVVYSNGWVYSAGSNNYGQLGHGDYLDRPYLKRIEYFVLNSISIYKVWAAGSYTGTNAAGCAYFQSSTYVMYSCGINAAGALVTTTPSTKTPSPCSGINATTLSHVIDVQVAFVGTSCSTYMLLNDGSLMVAGFNTQGQLGINSVTVQSGTFVNALNFSGNVSDAVSISANAGGTAAGNALYVDRTGGVWTTGYNAHGELGVGGTTNQRIFTQVTALAAVTISKAQLGGGAYGFGWAIDTTGKFYTWGYNGQNNLFKDSVVTPQAPAAVPAANLPGGSIAKVFFSKGSQGLATTPQLILLTTTNQLVYAGADNGQLSYPDMHTNAFNRLPMPFELMTGSDTIADLFVHGTGLLQRWFILTATGHLYGCGSNADAICAGAVATSVLAANAQWQTVALSKKLN